MATKPSVIIPGVGAAQGYTIQPDGTMSLDVSVVSGSASTAANLQPDSVYYSSSSGGLTDPADVVAFPAAGAGVRNYMTGLQYINSGATAGEIVVKDGSVVIWRGYAPGGMESLASVYFSTPLRGSANTAMSIGLLMGQMAVRVSAQGYKGV
jgi:hypothetical protein